MGVCPNLPWLAAVTAMAAVRVQRLVPRMIG
jgi:hypothetical protein